jgi:hypothetical protein
MPISNNSSYVPTMNEFIAHWGQVNAAINPDLTVPAPDGTAMTLSGFSGLRDSLQAQFQILVGFLNDKEIARGSIRLLKEKMLAHFNEFNAMLDETTTAAVPQIGIRGGRRPPGLLPALSGGPIADRASHPAKSKLEDEGVDMKPMFEAILDHVAPPVGDPEKPLQIQVTTLDYSEYPTSPLGTSREHLEYPSTPDHPPSPATHLRRCSPTRPSSRCRGRWCRL